MKFHFSLRNAIKEAWNTFKKHPWFFIGIAFVMFILNAFGRTRENHHSILISLLIIIASVIWSYVALSTALDAVKGNDSMLTYAGIKSHLPDFRQFMTLVGVGLLGGLFIVVGFIVLVIPGIYIGVRLAFSNYAFVDRQENVWKTIKYAWSITKGDVFWTIFLTLILSLGLMILGVIALGVGILITYPLVMLMLASLYIKLSEFHSGASAIVVQPVEILPAENIVTENE